MSLGGAYQFFIFSLMWCLDGACNITFPIPPPIYLEPQDSASTHFGKDLIVRNRNEYKEMLLQEMFMIPKKHNITCAGKSYYIQIFFWICKYIF